ncbi:hypothetical protein [Wenyingzhuangia sp. IMCC45467]
MPTSKFCVYLLSRQILLIWLCEIKKKQNQTKSFGLVRVRKSWRFSSRTKPSQNRWLQAKNENMKKKITINIILTLSFFTIYSQQKLRPQSFSYLSKIELNYKYEGFETPTIYFDSKNTSIINKKVDSTSIFYEEYTDDTLLHEFVITKIDKSNNEELYILFDYGLSADPNFSIVKKTGDSIKYIGSINGLILYIPGNGYLYAEGHTNNYFNQRKKYQFKNEKLTEIKQPFYYVGIKTKTKGLMKIYAEKNQTNIIANLPKDSEIEILLNDNEYFLIKTSFGLTGWWKYENSINEIFFKGD